MNIIKARDRIFANLVFVLNSCFFCIFFLILYYINLFIFMFYNYQSPIIEIAFLQKDDNLWVRSQSNFHKPS